MRRTWMRLSSNAKGHMFSRFYSILFVMYLHAASFIVLSVFALLV